jgi:transposase
MQKLTRKPARFKGKTVGLDLHKRFIQFSVLDQQGDEVAADRIAAGRDELLKLLERLGADGSDLQVCLEASGCFVWVFDLLAGKLGPERVKVAAPGKVRVIAESMEKTDASDAWWLAYLLFEGRLPEAFVAQGGLRELRVATRELRSVINGGSDQKRRLKSHLAQLGLDLPSGAWASVKGRAQIEALVQQCQREHGLRGEAIARAWALIQVYDREVQHWEVQVEGLAAQLPQVELIDQEIPGAGPVVAATVYAQSGDPRRYKSAKAYAKGTGLTPGYRESGGRRAKVGITREGSGLSRWALTRGVVACLRCTKEGPGLAVRRWVEKMSRRKRLEAAIVAAARKLAEGIWRLFALGEAFDIAKAFGGPAATRP